MTNELAEKVKTSIERIQGFASIAEKHHDDDGNGGYYLAFSGGKDSVVIKALMDMAGVKYDAHYRVTSVDPPELVQFIKEKHPDVHFEVPRDNAGKRITMWSLIPQKRTPPTRLVRYCCEKLKEDSGDGRFTVTGVRWEESYNRAQNQGLVTVMGKAAGKELKDDENFSSTARGGVVLVNDNDESRQMVDACVTRHKTCLNPIIDWTNRDVWSFIRKNHIPYCELYDCGWLRLGCIGCPLAYRQERLREFAYWPEYERGYMMTFDRMIAERKRNGMSVEGFETAQKVFDWWVEDPNCEGQIDLFEEGL